MVIKKYSETVHRGTLRRPYTHNINDRNREFIVVSYIKTFSQQDIIRLMTIFKTTSTNQLEILLYQLLMKSKIIAPRPEDILNWLSYNYLFNNWDKGKYVFPLLVYVKSSNHIERKIFLGDYPENYLPNSDFIYKLLEDVEFLRGDILFGMYLQMYQKSRNELSDEYKNNNLNNEITVMAVIKNPTIRLLFNRIIYWFSLIPLESTAFRFLGLERQKANTYLIKWASI